MALHFSPSLADATSVLFTAPAILTFLAAWVLADMLSFHFLTQQLPLFEVLLNSHFPEEKFVPHQAASQWVASALCTKDHEQKILEVRPIDAWGRELLQRLMAVLGQNGLSPMLNEYKLFFVNDLGKPWCWKAIGKESGECPASEWRQRISNSKLYS